MDADVAAVLLLELGDGAGKIPDDGPALVVPQGAVSSEDENTYFGTPLMWLANGSLSEVGQWSAHSS